MNGFRITGGELIQRKHPKYQFYENVFLYVRVISLGTGLPIVIKTCLMIPCSEQFIF